MSRLRSTTSAGFDPCSLFFTETNGTDFRWWELGDVDGDGKADLILMRGRTNPPELVCYSTGVTPILSTIDGCRKVDITGNAYWTKLGDFNGDGKADFMFRKSADDSGFGTNCTIGQICSGMQWKTCFAEFTGAQTPTTPRFSCHVNWVMGIHGAYQDAVVADFNGDGIADMAEQVGNNDLATTAAAYACPAGVNGVTTSCWRVCISAGDGAFQFTDPGVRFGANALGNPAWIDSQGNVLGSSPTDLNSTPVPRSRQSKPPGATANRAA